MTEAADPPQIWEQLVTDGHVRAARFRRIQPVLIAIGIGLIVLGGYLFSRIKPPELSGTSAAGLAAVVEAKQRKATIAFAGLPPPRVGESKISSLPLANDLPAVQDRIVAALNSSGKISDDLGKEVEAPTFWREAWKPGETITTGSGRVRLVGALVNAGTESYPRPARWLGAFRRGDAGWTAVSINGPDFVRVGNAPNVPIEAIPVTLEPLLDTGE